MVGSLPAVLTCSPKYERLNGYAPLADAVTLRLAEFVLRSCQGRIQAVLPIAWVPIEPAPLPAWSPVVTAYRRWPAASNTIENAWPD